MNWSEEFGESNCDGCTLGRAVLSYEQLRQRADEFLAKHHSAGTIPIPIEEIVEIQLAINIVPMPGLHQLMEVDGFLTSDLREIYVDEFVYMSRPGRYRFTLAHEVAHLSLHRELYQRRGFRTSDEWKSMAADARDCPTCDDQLEPLGAGGKSWEKRQFSFGTPLWPITIWC